MNNSSAARVAIVRRSTVVGCGNAS
jgi:hypothetical protein